MRVLNVLFAKGLGGIEQATLDYSRVLTLQSIDCHALISNKAAIAHEMQQIVGDNRCHTITALGQWDPMAKKRISSLLKNLKPDAIIAHGKRAVRLLKAASMKQHIPLIGVTHNYTTEYLTQCDAVLCTTKALRQVMLKKGMKQTQLHSIPNMVCLPESPITRPNRSPLVIGTYGRMVPKKGFDQLLHALASLRDRGIAFSAIIGGDGSERNTLEALAQSLRLTNRVRFPGWVTNKEMFFRGIDVFCLPSLHEPFGIVLLEAMAHHTPIISYATEGPSEILRHEESGLLVDIEDSTALSAGLEVLLTMPESRRFFSDAAYEDVCKYYTLQAVAPKLRTALDATIQQAT